MSTESIPRIGLNDNSLAGLAVIYMTASLRECQLGKASEPII